MKRIMPFLLALSGILATGIATAQNGNQAVASSIQVIQFHSEHRCVTCLNIEKHARATLAKSFPKIPFRLINVDDKANEKLSMQFEASGTALFLYNPKTGKKKDLTGFAFMNAENESVFAADLKKHIRDFSKQ